MHQLAEFLSWTVRRLRTLGKIAGHFFRNGKLAVKIPFFVEIEISFEMDGRRPR